MQDQKSKRKEVAALAFDPAKHDVPIVVATGRGIVADNILLAAEQAGIPIIPDKTLAQVLNQLSIGDAIPSELYAVVAQILLFVGEIDQQFGEKLEVYKK